MSRALRALALVLACMPAACSAKGFTPVPALPALPDPALDPSLYERIDLSLAIWESVSPSSDYLRVGGAPSYIEPLRAALAEAGLFREVIVAPWRPAGGDVVLHLTDAPRADLRDGGAAWNMVATLLFAGLPSFWLKYQAEMHSDLTVESEGAAEPLRLEVRQTTHLSGKLIDWYGAVDARTQLAGRHSRVVAGRLVAEFLGRRAWFKQAVKTNTP